MQQQMQQAPKHIKNKMTPEPSSMSNDHTVEEAVVVVKAGMVGEAISGEALVTNSAGDVLPGTSVVVRITGSHIIDVMNVCVVVGSGVVVEPSVASALHPMPSFLQHHFASPSVHIRSRAGSEQL